MSAIRNLPRLHIDVDGSTLSQEVSQSLAEVRVRQQLSLPTQCELTFRDPSETATTRLRPGARLTIHERDVDATLFEGEITACEYVYEPDQGREFRVRGYDLLHRLRKRQQLSAYAELTVEDLTRELAGDLNLPIDAQESGPFFDHIIQYHRSDFELLTSIAGQCGLYLTVRDGRLHLLTLSGVGKPRRLCFGENLLEARIDVNAHQVRRDVEASGWSPLSVETHTGQASQARVGRQVDAEAWPERVGANGRQALLDYPSTARSHAEAYAQAELDWRVAREVTLWGVAEGNPHLRPGTPVDVLGVAQEVSGRYCLAEVTHTIDDRHGYVTELSSIPPSFQPRNRATIMTPGVVTRIDDPEDLARVRVTLPNFGGVETGWMGVLTVAAGSGKGLIAIPDVGDNVLVLCAEGNPAHGIVLGGLYGMDGAPDSGVSNGAVQRYTLLTAGGQRLTLDDDRSSLRVENEAGSFVELAPEEVRIHSTTDLRIGAPGQEVVIEAASIEFRRS